MNEFNQNQAQNRKFIIIKLIFLIKIIFWCDIAFKGKKTIFEELNYDQDISSFYNAERSCTNKINVSNILE
jgi:hypothetical protein